jgi:hypothetical protein
MAILCSGGIKIRKTTIKYHSIIQQDHCCVILVFSFITILIINTITFAAESNIKMNELICDNVKISIITKCVGESNPVVPDCIEQYYLFTNQITKKTIKKDTSGKLANVKDAKGKTIGHYLDALATGWVCVKGKSKPYLIVWYNTGGNCDECEWQEILDLNGNMLAATLPKTQRNLKSYDTLWLKLGLQNISAKDFSNIELK